MDLRHPSAAPASAEAYYRGQGRCLPNALGHDAGASSWAICPAHAGSVPTMLHDKERHPLDLHDTRILATFVPGTSG
jgi:hypothetical protein